MVDRRKRALRHRDLELQVTQHPERLRTRHLVNQVRPDEELRLAVGQRPHTVCVPDFFEKGFRHVGNGFEFWVLSLELHKVEPKTGAAPKVAAILPETGVAVKYFFRRL
jgi:hypothetical protein